MDDVVIFDVSVDYADEMQLFLFSNQVEFSTVFISDHPENCFRFRITQATKQQVFHIGLKYSALLLNAGVSFIIKQTL